MAFRSIRTAAIWRGIALGAVWTVAFVALASLADALGLAPNPAYRTFEWISGLLPGRIVTWSIDHLVSLIHVLGAGSTATAAKAIEKAMAVSVIVVMGAIIGGVIADLVRRPIESRAKWGGKPLDIGLATGAVVAAIYLLVIARDREPVMIVCTIAGFLTWGGVLGASIGATAAGAQVIAERRHVLLVLGAVAAATTIVASGLARLLRRPRSVTSGAPELPPPAPVEASSRIAPVPGTRPEITATKDFYRIDINLTPPVIESASWRLALGGLISRPRELTIEEVRARPAITQLITLECISNPVGGDLISTAPWTGCPLAALLDELQPSPDARFLWMEAADGFHESVSLADARDPRALLVYAMNGQPLTAEHGFPLRLYLPDRHGMKLPKWIRRIDAIAEARPGYWVERGWSATAIPHTTSVIDAALATGSGASRKLSIGGIAYAGARGISKVEVQIDNGPWQPAQLRTPALSQLTWVQWRLDAPYEPGPHRLRVRAYDGTGAPQDTAVRPPHPDGATGLFEKKVTV
jgi:DMSO/TMAO reductase YedYZ molybdopterin-dependent catalytic subunit